MRAVAAAATVFQHRADDPFPSLTVSLRAAALADSPRWECCRFLFASVLRTDRWASAAIALAPTDHRLPIFGVAVAGAASSNGLVELLLMGLSLGKYDDGGGLPHPDL